MLVRLDLAIAFLALIVALLAVVLVATTPGLGIPVLLGLAAVSALGSHWYREERLEAAR